MRNLAILKVTLLSILLLVILGAQFVWDLASYFEVEKIKEWLDGAGSFAPLLYMAVMMMAVIISPIPSLPLDIAAGAYFGPLLGTLYSVAGALAGAVISFSIARLLGRELIERYLGGHINFCTECSDRMIAKIIFFSRLMPVISFDVISYGAGLTKISLRQFSLATLFGMLPLTFIYNYSGSILVFGRGLTFALGVVMVILFLVMPKWLEDRGFMKEMKHRKDSS